MRRFNKKTYFISIICQLSSASTIPKWQMSNQHETVLPLFIPIKDRKWKITRFSRYKRAYRSIRQALNNVPLLQCAPVDVKRVIVMKIESHRPEALLVARCKLTKLPAPLSTFFWLVVLGESHTVTNRTNKKVTQIGLWLI